MSQLHIPISGGAGERVALRFDDPPDPRQPLALVYLHGFGSTQSGEKADWFRAAAAAEGWPFCSFDARGHGDSGGTLRELTLTRNLEDLAAVRAFLDARGYPRVALVGSSMGGATALWHAALHADSVVAAALIAPALGMLADLERWAGAEGMVRWQRDGVLRYRTELVDTDLDWQIIEDLRRHPVARLVAAYRTPTVLFQGLKDSTVDWHDAAELARRLPPGTIDLHLLPEGDHRLLDQKEALWRAAHELFRRVAAGAC